MTCFSTVCTCEVLMSVSDVKRKGLAQLLMVSCFRLTVECIRYFVFTSVFAEVAVGVWVLCCWEALLIASFHHLVLRWRGLIKFCREEQLPAFPSRWPRADVPHTPQTHSAVKSIHPNRETSRHVLTLHAHLMHVATYVYSICLSCFFFQKCRFNVE